MKAAAAEQTLFVRADADSRIGAGHVMRCLALSQAWMDLGGRAVFIGRLEGDGLRKRLAAEEIDMNMIHHSHPHWSDIDRVSRILTGPDCRPDCPSWLVLDGYRFDPPYQRALRGTGCRLLVIDDLAADEICHGDLLLNQNLHADPARYERMAGGAGLLLGPRFSLLRREFCRTGGRTGRAPVRARRILVTLGGADPDNVTGLVIEALEETGVADLEVRVVVGPVNPRAAELRRMARKASCRFELLVGVDDMAVQMDWADLAVAAAGSTCWELAASGVPAALLVLAENQAGLAASLAGLGAAVNLGWGRELTVAGLARELSRLINDQPGRQQLADRATEQVDCRGARRVAGRMLARDLRLRRVRPSDCDLLFSWANDPETRRVSFHRDLISRSEHGRWFAARLRDPASLILLGTTCSGTPVGMARFDIRAGKAVVSVNIAPEYRGMGFGTELIRRAAMGFLAERGGGRIEALVKEENAPSLAAFRAAGFRPRGEIVHQGAAALVMELSGPGEGRYGTD